MSDQGPHSGSFQTVPIALGERSYDILIGRGALDDPASFDGLPRAACAAIVTDAAVAPLYGQRLAAALAGRYPRLIRAVLPAGEEHKDW